MRDRTRGFTLVELLVVMSIIAVLAGLLLPVLIVVRGRSKHNASQAKIQDFSIALKAYDSDFGHLPADDTGFYVTQAGAASVGTVLSTPGPKGAPYYQFRPEEFNSLGRWVTALNTPYKYRENASKMKLPKGPLSMMNLYSFDMWARGFGDPPACSETTSDPADLATITNW